MPKLNKIYLHFVHADFDVAIMNPETQSFVEQTWLVEAFKDMGISTVVSVYPDSGFVHLVKHAQLTSTPMILKCQN